MTAFRPRRVLALSTLALVLGACGHPTGSDRDDRGTLSFSYSGAVSGQFSASGEFRPNSTGLDFAGAYLQEGDVVLVASEQTATAVSDLFVAVGPAEERSTTCDPSPVGADGFECGLFAGLVLGVNARTEVADRVFSGTVGTLTVAELTADRVRGSFSFTLVDDMDRNIPPVAAVQLRSGTFDVPLLDDDDLNALVPDVGLRALRSARP